MWTLIQHGVWCRRSRSYFVRATSPQEVTKGNRSMMKSLFKTAAVRNTSSMLWHWAGTTAPSRTKATIITTVTAAPPTTGNKSLHEHISTCFCVLQVQHDSQLTFSKLVRQTDGRDFRSLLKCIVNSTAHVQVQKTQRKKKMQLCVKHERPVRISWSVVTR